MTLNDPYPGFIVTPFFDAEYLRSGTRYRQFQWNTNRDLQTPYNDTKRRAVSLRQLSFLLSEQCALSKVTTSVTKCSLLALTQAHNRFPILVYCPVDIDNTYVI